LWGFILDILVNQVVADGNNTLVDIK